MDDPAGLIVLSVISAAAIVAVFIALMWAAVQDGRDEMAFRMHRAHLPQ